MKKILLIKSGFFGGIVSGLAGIGKGIYDSVNAKKTKEESESHFGKAFDYIPEEQSIELLGALGEVKRKRSSYESGASSENFSDQLSDMVSSQAQGINNLVGGNTGASITAMLGLSQGAGENLNKSLAQDKELSNQLLGMENKLTSDIVTREDEVKKQKADFEWTRANQKYVESASQQKSGMENILGGIATIADTNFDF